MQLTAFILLACCLQISAKVASQSINFSAKNASLESTFKAIRKQTDYSVFWNKRILKDAQPITLTVKEIPLLEFLDRILKGQSLTYSIEGNAILIKREPKPAAASETAKFISPPIDIRGRILDEYGAPVSGASVQIKGDLTKGTST
ncbi:MAG TPA: STN and carboxypeptidase regulatory-like domain-containing protein, partial [Flavitalea sp.]|nr:STN and carboxypeptidase regulatory-like domain-containing protein [Flavitalea sp.]